MGTAKKIIFALLLIFLPSQLGLHFWPEWAYINGVRVDYFSPTLYFTDALVLLLFLLEISNLQFTPARPGRAISNKFSIKKFSMIGLVGLFVLANIYFSLSPLVTLYKWLKVAELIFLAYWVAKNFKQYYVKFLLIPIFYSSLLAVWQFINQGSVGGLWWWLGERTFNSSTPGIALANFGGQLILRPYATFPHPNVLMGFLMISCALLIKYLPHISRKITALVLALVVLVLFLTPSRGSLLNGLNLRQQLNGIAIGQWQASPLIGTGLGTSPLYPRNITNFALLHQPIHNIYLLLLAEVGLVGLGLFVLLVIKTFHWLWLPVLFLGLFDHYFLTLQQGQLLLTLIIGIILLCRFQKASPGIPRSKS